MPINSNSECFAVLVRHGQCATVEGAGTKLLCEGEYDRLTEKARELREKHLVRAVFSSPAPRAIETAMAYRDGLAGINIGGRVVLPRYETAAALGDASCAPVFLDEWVEAAEGIAVAEGCSVDEVFIYHADKLPDEARKNLEERGKIGAEFVRSSFLNAEMRADRWAHVFVSHTCSRIETVIAALTGTAFDWLCHMPIAMPAVCGEPVVLRATLTGNRLGPFTFVSEA